MEQGPGQYFCEYDGTTLSSMVRRYIFNAKVMDVSGECSVQVFNEQVRVVPSAVCGAAWSLPCCQLQSTATLTAVPIALLLQAEQLLEMKADELAELRETGADGRIDSLRTARPGCHLAQLLAAEH